MGGDLYSLVNDYSEYGRVASTVPSSIAFTVRSASSDWSPQQSSPFLLTILQRHPITASSGYHITTFTCNSANTWLIYSVKAVAVLHEAYLLYEAVRSLLPVACEGSSGSRALIDSRSPYVMYLSYVPCL